MSVLISTGVMTAYIFSVTVTIFTGGETFFEAAAMLITFVAANAVLLKTVDSKLKEI